MEDTVKIFVLGFKKWAKLNKVNQTRIGKVVGKVQTTISDYWNDVSRPSTDMIRRWVDEFRLDYDDILAAGREELKKRENPTLNEDEIRRIIKEENQINKQPTDITTQRHRQVIESFKQKELALKLNELLLEIEQIDPFALRDAETTLYLLKLKAEQESSKKKASNNDP
jgi:transcriptional regulator with XRE-family HTH domain